MINRHNIKLFTFFIIAIILSLFFLEIISLCIVNFYNNIKGAKYAPRMHMEKIQWWDYCPVLGIKPKPNLPACRISDGSGACLGTDAYGFAHNGNPNRKLLPKPDNTYRIFILGGSSVWGTGIHSNNQTIAAQMERILNTDSKYPFKIEVINAGVRGYISYEEFSYLSKELLYYQPDMIVVLDGINDFYYPNHDTGLPPNLSGYQLTQMRIWNNEGIPAAVFHLKGFFSSLCPSCVNAWKTTYNTIRDKSYFIFVMENIAKKTKSNLGVKEKPLVHVVTLKEINPFFHGCYIQNIKNIIGVCQVNNIKCILLFQPTLASGHKDYLTPEEKMLLDRIEVDWSMLNIKSIMPQYYRIISEEFKKLNNRYHSDTTWIEDLESIFKDAKDTVYWGQVHYNETGARILAERISSIIKTGFLKKKNE